MLAAAELIPDWRGDTSVIERWLDAGITPDCMVEAIERCAAKRNYQRPYKRLACFDSQVRAYRAVGTRDPWNEY